MKSSFSNTAKCFFNIIIITHVFLVYGLKYIVKTNNSCFSSYFTERGLVINYISVNMVHLNKNPGTRYLTSSTALWHAVRLLGGKKLLGFLHLLAPN